MSNNDYYVSGRATEPADDPQAQYSETLRLIDGPAHCCDFGSEQNSLPTEHPTRASLGIPDDAIVFISGSNFYKVIPEVQEVWADRDPLHPLQAAEEALDLLPDAQLRVLSGTGFLIAYDDPIGVGRELTAFCA